MRVLCVTQGLEVTPTRKVNPQFFWLFGPHFKCQPYQWSLRCSKFVLERSTFRGLSQSSGRKASFKCNRTRVSCCCPTHHQRWGQQLFQFSLSLAQSTTMKLQSIFSQIRASIRVQGGKRRERESGNLGEGQVSESRMTPRTWTEIHYETCVLLVGQKFIMKHYVCY